MTLSALSSTPSKLLEVPQSSHYPSKSSSKVPNQVSFAQPVQPYLPLVPSLSPLFPLAESWCQLSTHHPCIQIPFP